MAIRVRGEMLSVTDQVSLSILFRDQNGDPVNTDSFPQISIIQPSGLVLLAPTSVGVTNDSVGNYSYIFTVPFNGPLGVFNDIWLGYVGGIRAEAILSFVVSNTNIPSINIDGYFALGDDPGFDYSQAAIKNINKLIKSLKMRLNSSGKSVATDSYGNKIYVDCDIFSIEMLVTFLATALWDFNQVPFFTYFQFDQDWFVDQFGAILVEGAVLQALASKALIEKSRESVITDNGISFQPASVSELMSTQYSTQFAAYNEKLKLIKNNLRMQPLGLGTFNMNSGATNSVLRRYAHLRARRLF